MSIIRIIMKTLIRILTQNDVHLKFQMFHRKLATVENTDQAASADPEGDRGSGPPWKITSYMGFYRE